MDIETSNPVMVTGATGYVAGWLIKRLLDEGLTVHAAVRNPDDAEKLKYLNALADEAPGTINYFKADLLDAGSYDTAMAGCSHVFHTASPFILEVSDPQRDLIDPAVLGTRNVLEAANRTESVTRVILTSSCAAMYADNQDIHDEHGGVLTEAAWNSTATLDYQPYSLSKTLAEKEAWNIAEAQDRWDLVTINPSLVLGPGINPHATSESFKLACQFGDGSLKPGAPRFCIGAVDVRDVAEAHVQAAFRAQANGRYITSGHDTDFVELGRLLLDKYGADWPLPRKVLPKWMVWIVGPMINKALKRRMVTRGVDIPFKSDNSKGVQDLGLNYRPLKTSMEEMFQQLIDSGQVKKK